MIAVVVAVASPPKSIPWSQGRLQCYDNSASSEERSPYRKATQQQQSKQQRSPVAFLRNGVQLGPLGVVQRWCCVLLFCCRFRKSASASAKGVPEKSSIAAAGGAAATAAAAKAASQKQQKRSPLPFLWNGVKLGSVGVVQRCY